jgi:hypothetical protein
MFASTTSISVITHAIAAAHFFEVFDQLVFGCSCRRDQRVQLLARSSQGFQIGLLALPAGGDVETHGFAVARYGDRSRRFDMLCMRAPCVHKDNTYATKHGSGDLCYRTKLGFGDLCYFRSLSISRNSLGPSNTARSASVYAKSLRIIPFLSMMNRCGTSMCAWVGFALK